MPSTGKYSRYHIEPKGLTKYYLIGKTISVKSQNYYLWRKCYSMALQKHAVLSNKGNKGHTDNSCQIRCAQLKTFSLSQHRPIIVSVKQPLPSFFDIKGKESD